MRGGESLETRLVAAYLHMYYTRPKPLMEHAVMHSSKALKTNIPFFPKLPGLL
jgi:hypothetical protein